MPPIHLVAGWTFFAIWLVTLLHLLAGRPNPGVAGAVLLLMLMALALPRASRHIQVMFGLLTVITLTVTIQAGHPETIIHGLGSAAIIAAFLPMLIVVRVAVESSPTVPRIRERVSEMEPSERKAWVSIGAHLLGSILTLGYVSIQRPMLPKQLKPDEALELASCGVRGLGISVVWSPFFVATAVASQLVPGVPAWRLILTGLGLALIGGLIAHLMFNRTLKMAGLIRALHRLLPTLPPTLILVGSVALCSTITGWSGVQSIVLVVPILCMGFMLLTSPRQVGQAFNRIVEGSGRMGDELLIMTGSMVFAGSIAGATLPEEFRQLLAGMVDWPDVLILAVVAVIGGLGMVGVHPMISSALLIPATTLIGAPIAAPVLAQMIMLAWSINSTTSAWTPPCVVTAGTFGIPLRQLVFGANLAFVAVFWLVAGGALAVLNRLLT
jgi:hypothetical protein